jgi:hypothetical protein
MFPCPNPRYTCGSEPGWTLGSDGLPAGSGASAAVSPHAGGSRFRCAARAAEQGDPEADHADRERGGAEPEDREQAAGFGAALPRRGQEESGGQTRLRMTSTPAWA